MDKLERQVEAFKDLYVLYRKKWIVQNADGTYSHKHFNLHDDHIKKHLKKEITLGIFSGEHNTKWLCFDVDFENDIEKAQQVTRELVLLLEEEHYISRENILISFSGSKGYHVEIFFTDRILPHKARKFYEVVISQLGVRENQVEFRPNFGQGVKLPLSINKKTGRKCHFVDNATLKKISDDALFNVVKVDRDEFLDNLSRFEEDNQILLDDKKAEEFVEVLNSTKIEIPVDYEERCMTMLSENQLIYPDSRHNSTYLLSIFLKEQGYKKDEAIDFIGKVIKNTFATQRDFIDKDTTEEFALKEVARLADYVYLKDKKFHSNTNKTIKIYENEILEVLKPKQKHLKQLAFIMLVHSKKHEDKNGVFYMTYRQMADMGADNNGARLLKHIQQLEKQQGIVDVVERNRKNGLKHLPNKYKVNISPNTERHIELNTNETKDIKVEEVVVQLLSKDVVKEIVGKNQFYEMFNQLYKEAV